MGPPFYRSYFGWGKKEIGLVFMGVAICAILGYSFMKFVSQQIETPGTGLEIRSVGLNLYSRGIRLINRFGESKNSRNRLVKPLIKKVN